MDLILATSRHCLTRTLLEANLMGTRFPLPSRTGGGRSGPARVRSRDCLAPLTVGTLAAIGERLDRPMAGAEPP